MKVKMLQVIKSKAKILIYLKATLQSIQLNICEEREKEKKKEFFNELLIRFEEEKTERAEKKKRNRVGLQNCFPSPTSIYLN